MKTILLSALMLISALLPAFAQVSQKDSLEVEKVMQPAQSVSFQGSAKTVSDAITATLKDQARKVKTKRGLITATKAKIPELSDQPLDVYFNVDSRGKKKNEMVTVIMAVRGKNDLFVSDSNNTDLSARIGAYLSGMPLRAKVYEKNVQVDALQDKLERLTKELKKKQKDQHESRKSMDRKLKEIDDIQSQLDELRNK